MVLVVNPGLLRFFHPLVRLLRREVLLQVSEQILSLVVEQSEVMDVVEKGEGVSAFLHFVEVVPFGDPP